MGEYVSLKKIGQIFGRDLSVHDLERLVAQGLVPPFQKIRSGALQVPGYPWDEISLLGEHLGFLKKPARPLVLSVFTTKGGVLKTTLTLNVARMAALHNIKTCVVGLDMQGDISHGLGHLSDIEDSEDLEEIVAKLNRARGLADIFSSQARLSEVIVGTDLPTLFYIPETPELASLNESISQINRREYWLKEKIIDPLRADFDLIIMDCSPNWNRLITNALVASDILLSPLECKINNFRNFRVFKHFLSEFKRDMRLEFNSLFVPTRFAENKKLTMEIFDWYKEHVPGCVSFGVRECTAAEEAQAMRRSVVEHAPTKEVAQEMRALCSQLFAMAENSQRMMPETLVPPLPLTAVASTQTLPTSSWQ